MARIQTFQGGEIQPEAPNVVPFRAPDFGPGIGPGLERLGQGLGEAAQKVDEIQDLHARIEANRLTVAYNNLAINIDKRVRSTLGEGAEAAADKGVEDLTSETEKLLSSASPRARRILAPELAERRANQGHEWWTYGFEQKKSAFDTSSQAANDKDLEAAGHTDSDAAAKPFLDSIAARNKQRATFFGYGPDWETQENLKAVSEYHKGRAETIGATSAYGAIKYAIDHRSSLSDADFNGLLRSYREEALHERAVSMYYGSPLGDDPNVTAPPPGTKTDEEAPTKTADPVAVFKGLILPNEGSKYVAHDSNGAPVKYGINGKANPDVDVANLTEAGAQKLFIDRYWKPSGADKLAPALAVVHADTYYLNKTEAMRILRASGGDVQKYIEMRNDFLAGLHASNPAKYPDYTSRNQRVEQYAASVGGNGQGFAFHGKVGPDTPMEPIISEIMSRSDIPLALKTELIDVARQDRNAQREDRTIREEQARDSLIAKATSLGDNFTSVKQLDPEALASAKPETVKTLTDWARENHDRKSDETLRPYVMETEVTDPQRFMSKAFILDLMKKGASHSLINEVQTQQEDNLKKQLNAKPDVISDGSLWSLAQPAFQAAGLDFEHVSTKGKTPAAVASERQANAQKKVQAIQFLHSMATTWALANPGKKPDEQTMRGWIGAALIKTNAGTPIFEANNQAIFNSMPEGARNTIIRELRRNGDTATGKDLIDHVVAYMYEVRALK
jgi:hypothetical protein